MTMPGSQTSVNTTTETVQHAVLNAVVHKEKFRKDYKPSSYRIHSVDMELELDYATTKVWSKLTLSRKEGTPPCDLVLDGEDLRPISIQLDGNSLDFSATTAGDPGKCHINAAGGLRLAADVLPREGGETFTLTTAVEIEPAKNLKLFGLFKSGPIICSQCEAEGFRRITYFLDRPDVMAVYTVKLIGDKEAFPVLLSNGNKVASGDCEDARRHYAKFEDPFPKPCYLFAVVAGQLAALTSVYQNPRKSEGKKVTISIYSEKEHLSQLEWAMESIKRAMQWDEDTFGLEYDLDIFNIVAVRDFNFGAMENKSLNIFISSLLLASPEKSSDGDFLRILSVVGHEYFHNWTGDRVTCRDWFQLTLKEGLTVFRDQEFSSDMGSRAVQRIEDVLALRCAQFPEDCGPMTHPIRPESYIAMDNFYTPTVYEKGAEVIRMYQTILGVDGFKKGIKKYFERHDGHAVTCDDFRAAMADANGVNFDQFERWYTQSGTPVLNVSSTAYDAATKVYRFTLRQHTPPDARQPEKLPLHIPVLIGLLDKETGKELKGTTLYELKTAEAEFTVEGISSEPVLSVLRNFSAPVKLVSDRSDKELAFLMAHDTDQFNKYDAGQAFMHRMLLERAQALASGISLEKVTAQALPEILVEAFRGLLLDTTLDGSFKGMALVMPSEDVLATDMAPCDPVAIRDARDSMRRQLASALHTEMLELYLALSETLQHKPYQILPARENVAPRRLRNVLLAYLTSEPRLLEGPYSALALNHFKAARNMTDKLSALRCLVDGGGKPCEEALKAFYDEANDDPLVLDKWFAIQAGANRPDVLEQCRLLCLRPEFSMSTPSRVRAVFQRFAMNSAHFHALDGAGYKFIGDAVIEIDQINSTVAARLAKSLIDWRKYDGVRQTLAKEELLRIKASPKLSADTFEIVQRGLEL